MDRMAGKPEQSSLFDLSDITDDQFFEQAETKVLEALKEFDGTMVNANALDYLIDHVDGFPWIIPEEWKNVEMQRTKHILFWGTRYRFEDGICVRTLEWSADARQRVWKAGYCWIDNLLNSQFPAAMVRKPPAPTE